MTKKNSLFNLAQAQNEKSKTGCDPKQGITERLLKKYRPSKVLSLIEEKMKDSKKNIAA